MEFEAHIASRPAPALGLGARAASPAEVRGPGLKAQDADRIQEPRTGLAPGGVFRIRDPSSLTVSRSD